MPFPEKRSQAQELLASAYSLDYLTEVEFEERVQLLQEADTFDKVNALVVDLPRELVVRPGSVPARGLDAGEQVIEGSGQVLRRQGSWLRSQRVVVRQNGSVVRLRMDDLVEIPRARVEMVLDVQGCMVRILVPRGTRVVDETAGHGSVIRVSRRVWRSERENGPVLVLSGTAIDSLVKVTKL
ncbi:MAG: DUF1707 SHOCT-like domain-containing protein [Spirochaetota bacterium]